MRIVTPGDDIEDIFYGLLQPLSGIRISIIISADLNGHVRSQAGKLSIFMPKEINMILSKNIRIQGTPEQIWKVITDIEGSGNTISAIQDITILEKPAAGLVGLKWEETRGMFGWETREVMRITDLKEMKSNQTGSRTTVLCRSPDFQFRERGRDRSSLWR